MQVKFLRDLISGIGTFFEGDVKNIEDEHVLSNWIENNLIEPFEDKKVVEEPKVEAPVVEEAPTVESPKEEVADVK